MSRLTVSEAKNNGPAELRAAFNGLMPNEAGQLRSGLMSDCYSVNRSRGHETFFRVLMSMTSPPAATLSISCFSRVASASTV